MPAPLVDLIDNPAHEVQVLYTRIDRAPTGAVSLTRFPLNLAPQRWFTAASWVKLPAVLLAAEQLTRLGLDADARIALEAPPATGNWDAGEPLAETFRRTVRRLFTVSDNVPFNRLYELIGQRELGESLTAHGYPDARLIARLGSGDVEANRRVGASRIQSAAGVDVERRDARMNAETPAFPFGAAMKGRGWQAADGQIVTGPHDFSRTNFIPLELMHDMLLSLVFPEAVPANRRWAIGPDMRRVLLTELARWPRESTDPMYGSPEYFDGYSKYFVVGDSPNTAPSGLRQFSKSGQAYGYLQDCAYVIDRDKGVEFLLAATIHANADGIYNDDKYEYEEISLPFLAALGRAVLEHEQQRPRAVRPTFDDLPTDW
jgi:Beta-lactamase enzyme family